MRYKPKWGCRCSLCHQARQLQSRDRQMFWLLELSIVGVILALSWAAVRWL